jgi:hypothetical protein
MLPRLALRLALLAAIVGAAASLSGCVFFSNAFWRCAASNGTNEDACGAVSEYFDQTSSDLDGDGVSNSADGCDWERGSSITGGCPDSDGDGVPDRHDRCPNEIGVGDGCPDDPSIPIVPGAGASVSLGAARHTYSARVTGRFARARSFRARDQVLRARGVVFTGKLAAGPAAPAGLRGGTWTARMNLKVSPAKSRATARGVALARFGQDGRICLRFRQLMHVGRRGARLLDGSFKVIGATGHARELAAASRFSGRAGTRRAWTLRASGTTGRRVPSALPRACRGL